MQYKIWLTTTPDDVPNINAAILGLDTKESAENNSYSLKTLAEYPFGIAHLTLTDKSILDFTTDAPSLESGEIVTIFRGADIEQMKDFFTEIGVWEKEKHGSGPWHYAHARSGQVIEVYPPRLTAPNVQAEIFFPPTIPKPTTLSGDFEEDPDGRRVRFQ